MYEQYQQQLRNLRARKQPQFVATKSEPSDSPPTKAPQSLGVLQIHRSPSGALTVARQGVVKSEPVKAEPAATPLKAEPAAKIKPELKSDSGDERGHPADAPNFDDLDEYTKAAIASLNTRRTKKKADAVLKRPAGAVKAEVKHEGAVPKPVKRQTKEPVVVDPAKIMRSMPSLPKDGSNPAPVYYKKGVIYTSRASKRFRAVRERGNMYTESAKRWNADKPTKESWAAAVKAVDEGPPKKKK